jgi:hypothetical protein
MAGAQEKNDAGNGDTEDSGPDTDDMQPMSFDIFVLSLNASALIHLGETDAPHGPAEKNVALARQTIDILGLLEAKTRGNLTGEEERLLRDVLFDLRMRCARVGA